MSITDYIASGYWTSSGRLLTFCIPVAKNLSKVSAFSVQSCQIVCRQSGGYALGSSTGKEAVSTTENEWEVFVDDKTNTLRIRIEFPSTRAIENNDACSATVDINLTFS